MHEGMTHIKCKIQERTEIPRPVHNAAAFAPKMKDLTASAAWIERDRVWFTANIHISILAHSAT